MKKCIYNGFMAFYCHPICIFKARKRFITYLNNFIDGLLVVSKKSSTFVTKFIKQQNQNLT